MVHDASPARLCEPDAERHAPLAEIMKPKPQHFDICQETTNQRIDRSSCSCPIPVHCNTIGVIE
jgi:hypothetical protein